MQSKDVSFYVQTEFIPRVIKNDGWYALLDCLISLMHMRQSRYYKATIHTAALLFKIKLPFKGEHVLENAEFRRAQRDDGGGF